MTTDQIKEQAELTSILYGYLKADQDAQGRMLDHLTDEQKEAFLMAAGWLKIIVDKDYHDKIMQETLKKYVSEVLKDVDIKR